MTERAVMILIFAGVGLVVWSVLLWVMWKMMSAWTSVVVALEKSPHANRVRSPLSRGAQIQMLFNPPQDQLDQTAIAAIDRFRRWSVAGQLFGALIMIIALASFSWTFL